MLAIGFGFDILTAGVVCTAALLAMGYACAVLLLLLCHGDAMLRYCRRCLTVEEAFRAVKGRVLLSVVGAFGLGAAMNKTGTSR